MTNNANIGTVERVAVNDLNYFHRNPRIGNVQSIVDSMLSNGVFRVPVVNRGTHTGRPMEILAGNHSVKAIRQIKANNPGDDRWDSIDVYMVDVDDDRANRIVLADNRTADLGEYNNTELLNLLDSIQDDMYGTGYLPTDLSALEELINMEAEPEVPPGTGDPSLDKFPRKHCQSCGYDVNNNPSDLPAWDEEGM